MTRRLKTTLASMLGAAALTLLAGMPLPAAAATTCDLVAAQGGSDSAAGTAQAPFGSAQQLVNSLRPGQTGCVRGTLTGDFGINTGGVTLTSEPGQRGTLVGQLKVQPGAHNVTVSNLNLDGRRASGIVIGPAIYGDDAAFIGNDVTNRNTGICFVIGTDGHNGDIQAKRTRIEGNRIHDCGRFPRTNNDHGIYVEHSLDARIIGNEIVDNADRGIQLYPNAQGTLIAGNVIDGNGVGIIFGGASSHASSNTTVRNNVIGNATARAAVESWYETGAPRGTGNVVENNCIYGAERISTAFGGFEARNNLDADPQFVDRAGKDYRLSSQSPCAAILAGGRVTFSPPATTPTAAPAAPATRPAPAAQTRPTVRPSARLTRSARLKLSHKRGSRSLSVKVSLRDPQPTRVQTVVEIKYGKRGWRTITKPRVGYKRASSKQIRLPRGVGKVLVRASVVKPKRKVVATMSVKAPKRRAF